MKVCYTFINIIYKVLNELILYKLVYLEISCFQAPLSCDKKESKDCIDKKCDVTFAIDTNSSVPVKLLDSSHLQIVPKFFKKVFCLCPDGGRTNESWYCFGRIIFDCTFVFQNSINYF